MLSNSHFALAVHFLCALSWNEGRVIGSRGFPFSNVRIDDDEVMSSFLGQFYASGEGHAPPREVLTSVDFEDDGALVALWRERFEQAVTLTFEGTSAGAAETETEEVVVTLGPRVGGPTAGAMPAIGLAVPPAEAAASLAVLAPLRALGPGYLVGHLDLRDPSTTAALVDLRRLAEALAVPVDLEIVLANQAAPAAELAEAAAAVATAGLELRAVIPSHLWAGSAPHLRRAILSVQGSWKRFPGWLWSMMPKLCCLIIPCRPAKNVI